MFFFSLIPFWFFLLSFSLFAHFFMFHIWTPFNGECERSGRETHGFERKRTVVGTRKNWQQLLLLTRKNAALECRMRPEKSVRTPQTTTGPRQTSAFLPPVPLFARSRATFCCPPSPFIDIQGTAAQHGVSSFGSTTNSLPSHHWPMLLATNSSLGHKSCWPTKATAWIYRINQVNMP